MRVYEAFGTSEKLTTEGRECDIEFGGQVIAKVWLRPADASLNPDYRRELAEVSVGLKMGEELEPEEDQELLWKVYLRSVVIRWEWMNEEDKKDPALKLNEKNGIALFRRLPKFFEAIQRGSRNWTNYRAAHEKDAAGN